MAERRAEQRETTQCRDWPGGSGLSSTSADPSAGSSAVVLPLGPCDVPGASCGIVKIPVADMSEPLPDTIPPSSFNFRTLNLYVGVGCATCSRKWNQSLAPGDENMVGLSYPR